MGDIRGSMYNKYLFGNIFNALFLTDGNGSTIGSAANLAMIVGVAVAALAAIAAAAFMMKKVSSPFR